MLKTKMAGASQRTETKLSLEIRTKSVEQTLVPLVTQVRSIYWENLLSACQIWGVLAK